jgi:peptidoglycan hydrolase-like protein with peptidoglycan-binding domain
MANVRSFLQGAGELASRAFRVGGSLSAGAAGISIAGTAASGILPRDIAIAATSSTVGIARGVAGIFGEGAARFAERHTENLTQRISGVDLDTLRGREASIRDTSENVGEGIGMVGTVFIPGGVFARAGGLAIRAAGFAARAVEIAPMVSRLPGVSRAAAFLAEHTGQIGTRVYAFGANKARELSNAVIDTIISTGLPAGSAATLFTSTAIAAESGNETARGSTTSISAEQRSVIRDTFKGLADIRTTQESLGVNADGILGKETAAKINETIRGTLNPANLNDTQRQTILTSARELAEDLKQNPPSPYMYDERVIQFQSHAYALGLYNVAIDGLAGSKTASALDQLLAPPTSQEPPRVTPNNSAPAIQP